MKIYDWHHQIAKDDDRRSQHGFRNLQRNRNQINKCRRASLEELLIDYQDYLRNNNLKEWDKTHPYAERLRTLNRIPNATYSTFSKGIENDDPEICVNVVIGLIKVTTYLLYKQICTEEQLFLKNGGLREHMTKARLAARHQGK